MFFVCLFVCLFSYAILDKLLKVFVPCFLIYVNGIIIPTLSGYCKD